MSRDAIMLTHCGLAGTEGLMLLHSGQRGVNRRRSKQASMGRWAAELRKDLLPTSEKSGRRGAAEVWEPCPRLILMVPKSLDFICRLYERTLPEWCNKAEDGLKLARLPNRRIAMTLDVAAPGA